MKIHPNEDLKIPDREPDHVEDDDLYGISFYWFNENICLKPRSSRRRSNEADDEICKTMYCNYTNALMYMRASYPLCWVAVAEKNTYEAYQRYIVEKELLGAFPE